MANVIFATENYFDADLVNGIDKSSQDSTYPLTNMYRFQRRGRTYRTDGNITIVAGQNDQIYFTDSGSNTVTATITAGNYTYDGNFLTVVKTAMEAVGADTYTVTVTASKRFKIESDATPFSLLTSDVAFTAAQDMGFDTTANLTGADNYEADFVRIHTEEWISVDFGIPVNPETVIMIGKRNTTLNISESATIKLQGHHFDVWTDPEYEQTISWHENVLFLSDIDGLHTEPLRYWRFYIEDVDNSLGYIEFSNFFIGECFVPARGCIQFGMNNSMVDYSMTVYSESGVALTDVRPQTEDFSIDLSAMTKEDQEAIRYIFEIYGTAKPFFIVMDPNEELLPSPQDFVKYVRFTSSPSIVAVSPNNWSASIDIREEL